MSNDHDTFQYTDDLPTDDSTSTSVTDAWRHPLNVGHLVMGIAFAGMVLVWALIAGDVVAGEDIRWLMPIPWVTAGGVGLVAMALAARRRS